MGCGGFELALFRQGEKIPGLIGRDGRPAGFLEYGFDPSNIRDWGSVSSWLRAELKLALFRRWELISGVPLFGLAGWSASLQMGLIPQKLGNAGLGCCCRTGRLGRKWVCSLAGIGFWWFPVREGQPASFLAIGFDPSKIWDWGLREMCGARGRSEDWPCSVAESGFRSWSALVGRADVLLLNGFDPSKSGIGGWGIFAETGSRRGIDWFGPIDASLLTWALQFRPGGELERGRGFGGGAIVKELESRLLTEEPDPSDRFCASRTQSVAHGCAGSLKNEMDIVESKWNIFPFPRGPVFGGGSNRGEVEWTRSEAMGREAGPLCLLPCRAGSCPSLDTRRLRDLPEALVP